MKTFAGLRALELIRACAVRGVGLYCSILTAVAAGAVSSRAHAAVPSPFSIATQGVCPSAERVAMELRTILPALDVTTTSAATADVVLAESEAGVSVTVLGAQRDFADPARQCEDRAKQAAVFIALTLDPLRLPAIIPVPAAPAVSPLPVAWDLEVGPMLAVSPWSTLVTTPISGGGSLRLRWGRLLSLTAGATVLSSSLEYPNARARELLIPLDAGGRVTWAANSWDVAFELSASLAPAHLRGEGLDLTESGWRVELGARSALLARWWITRRLGVMVSESGLLWPRPVRLKVGGVGEVGRTPSFWLGSQLGLVLRLN